MTDLNPDTPDQPIIVPATAFGDQAGTLARDILLVTSAIPALLAVLGTHDVNQIVAYVTGAQFAPALGVITLAATIVWRQWNARKRHTNDVKVAASAPNSVAIVKAS